MEIDLLSLESLGNFAEGIVTACCVPRSLVFVGEEEGKGKRSTRTVMSHEVDSFKAQTVLVQYYPSDDRKV
jgi:hypothetical protein